MILLRMRVPLRDLLLTVISPARFYVSMIAKMIMRHLLLRYEFKLVNEQASSTLPWGTNLLPHPMLRMLIRERT